MAQEEVKDNVKDRYVFMDQGGELYRSKAIRDLFEKEFSYDGYRSSSPEWSSGER